VHLSGKIEALRRALQQISLTMPPGFHTFGRSLATLSIRIDDNGTFGIGPNVQVGSMNTSFGSGLHFLNSTRLLGSDFGAAVANFDEIAFASSRSVSVNIAVSVLPRLSQPVVAYLGLPHEEVCSSASLALEAIEIGDHDVSFGSSDEEPLFSVSLSCTSGRVTWTLGTEMEQATGNALVGTGSLNYVNSALSAVVYTPGVGHG